jgi:ATP-dependent RNA helicase RhlE
VVNYDLPNVPEDYVHRIGRTGRAGATGEAVSLVCVDEHIMLRDIERLIKRDLPREVIAGFEPDPTARPQPIQLRSGNGGGGGRNNPPRGNAQPRARAAAPGSRSGGNGSGGRGAGSSAGNGGNGGNGVARGDRTRKFG